MTAKTLDRVALLIALIPYLVAERSVAVSAAAAHFEVSETRIRDAVQLIFMSGVPDGFGDFNRFDINVDAFFDDDIIELGFLPALDGNALRLAPREANAVLAGLSLIAGLQNVDASVVAGLRHKLQRAAVRSSATLAVDAPRADGRLQTLRDAIEHRVVVQFEYQKPGAAAEQRLLAPTALELRDGEAYLVGYDLDREAERRFRLDRARDVRVHETEFPVVVPEVSRPHLASNEVLVVDATLAAAALLEEYVSERIGEFGDRVRLRIPVWEAGSIMHQIAALGGDAIIVEPLDARRAMRQAAADALSNYSDA